MWLLRAKRWAHKPPSWGRIKLVFGVITACALLVLIEKYIGLPDWMSADHRARRGISR
jgi:hypothetical protein